MARLPLNAARGYLAGDVIAFGGEGLVSEAIERFTASPVSHIGMMVSDSLIIESTTLDGYKGVSIHPFENRLATYQGKVWLLPLSRSCSLSMQLHRTPFLAEAQAWNRHVPYDKKGILRFGLRMVLHQLHWKDDPSRMFCSDLVTRLLQAGGVLSAAIAPKEQSPEDVCRMPIYGEDYYQLLGAAVEVPHVGQPADPLVKLAA